MTSILLILDGWGIREEKAANAIALAKTPNYDFLRQTYPHAELQASGTFVGLPEYQMGNSEVGHLTIGAGRVINQTLPRISKALSEDFSLLDSTFDELKKNHKRLHLVGLLSTGGIHSHQDHFEALYDLAIKNEVDVCTHVFTDGRDTPPTSGLSFCERFLNDGKRTIHSIGGRFYGMDRDNRWDRIQKAYDVIVNADGKTYDSVIHYIQESYKNTLSDEFIVPAHSFTYEPIEDGDTVLFVNFRADRARELSKSLCVPGFSEFPTRKVTIQLIGMTEYEQTLPMHVLFPIDIPKNTLGECLAEHGLTQLRVAETEKYAHVTFFLNGGREHPFQNETRELIASPNVQTYDKTPEMSLKSVSSAVLNTIGKADVIIANFANPDMIGHTGNLEASIKAIEAIDKELGHIYKKIQEKKGRLLITADHGNVEYMWDEKNNSIHTAHTTNPVPFIVVDDSVKKVQNGSLADVAPTFLSLLHIPLPKEMTGHNLCS